METDYMSDEWIEQQKGREEAFAKREKRKEGETMVAHALYQRYGRPATAREIRGFLDGTEEEQQKIWDHGLPVPGPRTVS